MTQNLHLKELKKLKKLDIEHTLELKMKNQKIEELVAENKEIIASKESMQRDHDEFLENMKQKFEVELEEQIEKRTSKLMDELNLARQSKMVMDEDEVDLNENPNELIETLKADIRRLEKNNERDNNMFFKHNQIFEHKLERETKMKKELEDKVKSLQRAKEQEAAELNSEI